MTKVSVLYGALFSVLAFTGCSETLPLGTATTYKGYSNAVIVGAVIREPITGKYTVAANGFPIHVTAYNNVHQSPSETVEDDQLETLIGLQAGRLARRMEIREEVAEIVSERSPKDVHLNPDLAQRPYMGTTHGIPPQ